MNGKLNPSQNTNIDTKTDLENKCHVSTGQARTLRANKAPWNVFICASEPHSSLFVESSTFPLLSAACSELQVSSSPLIASATLHHPPTWQQNMFVLELLSFLCGCPIPHPPHVRFFSSLIIITVGFYRRDRQIMGVVSTLQLRAVIHTNFFLHNHRHWQSPLISFITTILSSSEMAHCTPTSVG